MDYFPNSSLSEVRINFAICSYTASILLNMYALTRTKRFYIRDSDVEAIRTAISLEKSNKRLEPSYAFIYLMNNFNFKCLLGEF